MPQTSYTAKPPVGLPGQLYGIQRPILLTKQAETNLPFGIAVKQGTAELEILAPTAAADEIIGVVVRNMHKNTSDLSGTNQVREGDLHPVLCEGMICVTVEDAVSAGGAVFVRHTAPGEEVLGAFRGSAGGVAELTTITPTAANSTHYVLNVSVGDKDFQFEYTSDGSATDEEICDGLRAAMTSAGTDFSSRVTAGGTATLTLTGANAGEPLVITSNGPGVLGIVETTPSAAIAKKLPGARFIRDAGAGEIAVVQLNLPA